MAMFTYRGRGWLAATALAALGLAAPARAQYAPYGSGAVPYAAQQQQQQYNGYSAQTQQPQYAAQGAYQGYAATQPGYAAPQTGYAAPQQGAYATPQTGYAQPQYGAYGAAAPRVAMAYNNGATTPTPAASGETLPLTPPVEQVPAGTPQNGGYVPATQPAVGPVPTPMPEQYGAPVQGYGNGYETYPSAGGGAGCATGNCNTGGYAAAPAAGSCNTGYGYGACDTSCNTYSTYGGMGGALGKHAGCGYWFGGVYGLLMDRDNSNKYPLVFTAPDMPVDSYPTFPPNVVLNTRDVDVGFQPGVEFRLGRTFGCGYADPCNPCGGSCGPRWGLEAAYWTLFEDDATAQYVDQGTLRTYTMMPMYGLMYDNSDDGVDNYRPVNEYWDHAPPTQETVDIEVRLARVRSSLEVHNVEVNLLRLGVCGGGGAYSAVVGPAAGGGCGTGYGSCDSCDGCDGCYGGCATPRGSRYSCTGVVGFRWLQLNEDFMFGVDFDNNTTVMPNDGFLDYYSNVENNLFGAQVGCNGMYRIGCKWGLHCNTLVGLYGNDIDVQQYFNSPTGLVQYTVTGEQFGNVRAYKTDVAMLGELRLGASYQATCKCRLYGGWRAIGLTGIALATDQTPVAFLGSSQMSQYVNSNGSMILHGLQAGVEFNY
jgi:hypothetical protein